MDLRSNTSTPLSQSTYYYTPSTFPATALAPAPGKPYTQQQHEDEYESTSTPERRVPAEQTPRRVSARHSNPPAQSLDSLNITPTRRRERRSSSHEPSTPQRSLGGHSSRRQSSSNKTTPSRQASSASAANRVVFTRADDRSPLQKLELELKHISKEEGLVGATKQTGLSRSLSKRQETRLQQSTTNTSRVTSREYSNILSPNDNRYLTDSPAPMSESTVPNVGGHLPGLAANAPSHPGIASQPPSNIDNRNMENGTTSLPSGSANHPPVDSKNQDRARNSRFHFHKTPQKQANLRKNMLNEGAKETAGPKGPIIRLTHAHQDVPDVENMDVNGHFAEPTSFNPPIIVKCGPLMRYLGLRREQNQGTNLSTAAAGGRQNVMEVWRGSIMVMTTDSASTYDPAPSIKMFVQSTPLQDANIVRNLAPKEIPVTEATTMNERGEPQIILPTTAIPAGDLSHEDGLGGLVKPTNAQTANAGGTATRRIDGEKCNKFAQGQAMIFHRDQGYTFWRFNIEVELGPSEQRIAYRINNGPAVAFWVPAHDQTMNIMFHSCNGFSSNVKPEEFCGPDPLWRDVLRVHANRPYHVMIGGGDQLYNDCVTTQTTLFKDWLTINKTSNKRRAPFTEEMRQELETFYIERYAMWFSQGLFGVASSQIPMVNIWDDHDIIDGFGSYNPKFNGCEIFAGLGNIAFKYYMLFQQQTGLDEGENDEPSWILGAQPGPYIQEHSRSIFQFFGRRVAFLGLDCRTERTRDLLVGDDTYRRVFSRLDREVIAGETRHLIVLLGVPIAYPRLVWLENILTSSLMHPFTYLGALSHGTLNGFLNKFDGSIELVDDMMDHWTASGHKSERNQFILQMQTFAQTKGVRVTFLGGDVHLATFGHFRSKPSLAISKSVDHRYMVNVVSSAIVNTPPPGTLADLLNKRNKIHKLSTNTHETQIKIFFSDPKGKKRNNNTTLPARNYCTISENTDGHPISTYREVTEPEEEPGDEMERKGGLDCVINCEIDQHDPSGATKGYGLTVPALEMGSHQSLMGVERAEVSRASLQ